MPATDFSSASFGRSILSLRRDYHASMDSSPTGGPHHHHSHSSPTCPFPNYEADLESFQRQIIDRFLELSAGKDPESPFLSLNWIRSLLHAFHCCQEEFRIILMKARSLSQKPPLDRLVQDFFDRSVKALDVCNAIRDGIEQIREWRKLLEIVLVALDSDSTSSDGSNRGGGVRVLGEGQFRRAKKALIDLSISMLDEKDSNSVSAALAHRNRSFGRHNAGSSGTGSGSRLGHFRSLSWSVSRSWSAARQLQAIGNNLTPPRANEVAVTGGVAGAVYAMGSVLLLVMWALVAAIPCQDRGLHMHFSVPRGIPWAGAVMGVHERVLEESRRKERRNACGLLREIYQMEKCARGMLELVDSVQFPLSEDKEREVREQVGELRKVYDGLKDGLDPLERQVREVFHRIVISRTEGLDSIGR